MKTFLKIKIASLVAERKIIKREMSKWTGPKAPYAMHLNMDIHQEGLATQVRSGLIAYGFLRGRKYEEVENKPYYPPNWEIVEHNIERFGQDTRVKGQPIDLQAFHQKARAWLEEAKEHVSDKVCHMRRFEQQKKGTQRRLNYKAKYWRPEPSDQAKLKAELKAKWEHRQNNVGN